MRAIIPTIAAVLTVSFTAPALAAQAPTYARCETLAEQRGATVEGGQRNHRTFVAECMAGKIPEFAAAAKSPTSRQTSQAQSAERCEALAEERGAAVEGGQRNHRQFVAGCMAGKIR